MSIMSRNEIVEILASRAPTSADDPGFKMWSDLVWDFANRNHPSSKNRIAFAVACNRHGLLVLEEEA